MTPAAIKAASDKLTEVSYDVFGKIYQQAQQQNPALAQASTAAMQAVRTPAAHPMTTTL